MNKAKLIIYASLILLATCSVGWYIYGEDIIEHGDLLYTPNDPVAVANDFWIMALEKNDSASAKHISDESYPQPLIPGFNESDHALLGQAEQDNGVYFIDTKLILVRDGRRVQVPIYTVVVSQNGKFKVDLANTLGSVEDAALDNALSYYTDAAKAAHTLFTDITLSDEEKTRLLEVNLANMERNMCLVREKIIGAVQPNYATKSNKPVYCL